MARCPKLEPRFGSRAQGRLALFLVAGLAAEPGLAQTVYKSVDPQGEVSYSDQPSADSVAVESIPQSNPADGAEGKDEIKRIQGFADKLESERKAREAEARPQPQTASAPIEEPPDRKIIVNREQPYGEGAVPMPLPADGIGHGAAGGMGQPAGGQPGGAGHFGGAHIGGGHLGGGG
jgi:hypothetical protein